MQVPYNLSSTLLLHGMVPAVAVSLCDAHSGSLQSMDRTAHVKTARKKGGSPSSRRKIYKCEPGGDDRRSVPSGGPKC